MKKLSFYLWLAYLSITIIACTKVEDNLLMQVPNNRHPDFLACLEATWSGDEPSNLSRLRVAGNKIVDDACREVLLRGVTVIDPYFLTEFEKIDERFFKNLKAQFNPGIIRIPVHPDLYEHSPNYLEKYVDPLIQYCHQYNIYAFVGYHAHGNIATNKAELPNWRFTPPWQGNPYNPSRQLAEKALTDIVSRYKNKPWVIYGVFNEPAYIAWKPWKDACEQLIDVVQAIDPKAVLMVSGTNWGYDLSGAVHSPIQRKNIIYESHPYPWKGNHWKTFLGELSQQYPVFLGEWGFDKKTSSYATIQNYGQPLLDFCDRLKIGWTTWIYDDEWTPAMLDRQGGFTEFGKLVQKHLKP